MKLTYCVEITRTTTHRYIVPDCNTPEEAEDIATRYLEDGDTGEQVDSEILDADVYACEEQESD